ncbi:MAG: hypothetical protein R8P61_13270 [Bacteroidia bacterium]|nr:hypothetical protein [Bacteroidia bacterium]
MQASALVYCKKSPKRVVLVSEDESLEEEIEGILSQINLPKVIKRHKSLEIDSSILEEENPHMVIIDYETCSNPGFIKKVKQFDPELPLILIHASEKAGHKLAEEVNGRIKFMPRDTVRFSGQILYKRIHSYAIKNFQEQRENTRKKIEENIQGLTEIQDFWNAESHQIDPSYKKVLAELASTLNYLQMLNQEFDTSWEFQENPKKTN